MTTPLAAQGGSTYSLRTLYFVRAGFSVVWAVALGFLGSANPAVAAVLLAIYPLWDAGCSIFDARANAEARGTQTVNALVSAVVSVAVVVALGRGVPETLIAYGAWAIVSGAIQLALALRRRSHLGGQWPMIFSGGLSTFAGLNFIVTAHSPKAGLVSLAGYAGMGAWLYALSAFRMRRSD